MNSLIIIGAGGHGKVVAETADAMQKWADIRFLDDKFPEINRILNYKVVGSCEQLKDFKTANMDLCIAIGSNKRRLDLMCIGKGLGYRFPPIVHPTASIGISAKIEEGTVIFSGGIVNAGSVIKPGCIVNSNAVVDHDCVIGTGAHLSPGSTIGGGVNIGSNVWVGIGASIINGITIGANTIIGAGAVVIRDIPDNVVAVGVPAEVKRKKVNGTNSDE